MKRRALVLIALLLAALVLPASPAAAGPYCGIRWGSLAKANAQGPLPGDVIDVRTGRHACYDRLVIAVDGPFGGYSVSYVSQVTAVNGSVVPVRGGARLQVVARAWATGTSTTPYFLIPTGGTVQDMRNVAGYRTFRQVAWAGSSGGITIVALGVRARLPVRAFLLTGPVEHRVRLVVDVAHRW